MVKYSWKDFRETATGAFLASLFFLAIRGGNPLNINPIAGLIIVGYIIYVSNPKPLHKNLDVLAGDVLITYGVVSVMAIIFKLATIDLVTFGLTNNTFPNLDVFGSAVSVAFWISLPLAVLYNRLNITNKLSTIFIKKRWCKLEKETEEREEDKDIYSKDHVETLLENDEINSSEEGFMKGYNNLSEEEE